MGRYYEAARSALKSAAACLAADQREWIRARRDACADASCLRQVYSRRLAELDPLQPGVTRIRNLELPAETALVWIVPPAADGVAAPVDRKAHPLVARGAILNEVATGDGFILRSPDGRRLLMVPLMFLESPTLERLEALARAESGASYEVRGYAERSADGAQHFAPSRCLYIYRASP